MKKILKFTSILLLLIHLLSCSEDQIEFTEYGTITGKVIKENSFDPIENAKVSISPSNNTTFTDAEGKFEFIDVSKGDYSIKAEKEYFITGFEPVTVSVNETVNVIIELADSNALNRPPTTAILLTPTNNTANVGISVTLTWEAAIDPDDDDILYDIEVRNDFNNNVISIEDITELTHELTGLQYGVKYFWQVIASDTINANVISSTFTFETSSFPDNRFHFVRAHNGNNIIYSSDVDGNLVAITSLDDNSWRPRKNNTTGRIAFLKTHNSATHIFTMKKDGTNVQQVTQAVQPSAFLQSEIDFSWATNGSRIIYPSFDKLYIINANGSGNQLLYQTTDGSFITECDWSDDETIIALKTNNSAGYNAKIFTINMAGTILTNVLQGVNGAISGIHLSVNNQKLLYIHDVSGFENTSYRQMDSHVFIYNFNTLTSIDYSSYKPDGTNDLDARFSPNEAKIIVVNTSNDAISEKKIVTLNIGNDEIRNDLFSNAMMPDWE